MTQSNAAITATYIDHMGSETLAFVSAEALTQFLNYSEYECEVTTQGLYS
jgi:hypothetical protein